MSTLGYAPKRKLRFCQPLSTFVNADNLYNTLNNSLVPIVNAVIAHMPVFCMTMHRQKKFPGCTYIGNPETGTTNKLLCYFSGKSVLSSFSTSTADSRLMEYLSFSIV